MIYTSPFFSTNTGYFRGHIDKNKEFIPNKIKSTHIFSVGRRSGVSCREGLIGSFSRHVATLNPMPLASMTINGKVITLPGTISLSTSSINLNTLFDRKDIKNEMSLILDYVLGIIGVCLSHGKEELVRRKRDKDALANTTKFTKGTYGSSNPIQINYTTLSPFWTASPPLTSFMLGLARDCFSAVVDGNVKIYENLIDLEDKKNVYSIINKVNHKKAKKLYYEMIIPFFESLSDVLIVNPKFRRMFLDHIVEHGYQTEFKPERMREYWTTYKSNEGYNWYCNNIKAHEEEV